MSGKLVRGMPAEQYHAVKALSAGGLWTLVEKCPAHFWHQSAWNPDFVPENKTEFDIGTALHLAVLEPAEMAERIVRIEQLDYRTKEARDTRDAAWTAGKTPLKPKEWVTVESMALAIGARPNVAELFRGGDAEVSLFWDWAGIPCKARPDYLSADCKTIVDAKSTVCAHPRAMARTAYLGGWYVRDAWYREAVTAATGVVPERYIFAAVEKEPPHLVQCYQLDERSVEWGRQIIRAGMHEFAGCLAADRWPAYSSDPILPLSLSSFAEFQLAERAEAGEFSRISAADARRSLEWLEP